jgi:M6 family metalloprotease-like protein
VRKSLLYLFTIVLVLSACTTETVGPQVPAPEVSAPEVVESEVVEPEDVEQPEPALQVCRLENQTNRRDVTIGFPMFNARLSTLGVVRAKVLYVDFRDDRLDWSLQQMESFFSPYSNHSSNYFGTMSNSRLDMQFELHPEVIQLSGTADSYKMATTDRRWWEGLTTMMMETLVLADPSVDFTGIDFLVFVINPNIPYEEADISPAFTNDVDFNPFITNEATILNATVLARNTEAWSAALMTHEIGHLLGLVDFYDYAFQARYENYHRFVGGWDVMGLIDGQFNDMFAWNKYLLGWLDDEDVDCIRASELTQLEVTLGNEALPNTSALLVIQESSTRALMIEAKLDNEYCVRCYGVLVYSVDSSIDSGNGPLQIHPATRNTDPYMIDALLQVGDELQVGDVLIRVIEGYDESFVVSVTNTN